MTAASQVLSSITFEQLLPGDAMVRTFRAMVLTAEAEREQVEPWIDAVISELDDRRRLVFIAKQYRSLVGYMILKPREQKISTIWVEPKFRRIGLGAKFYGLGFVNLGVTNPYTAFMPDMVEEMRPLARSYNLVLDDMGPLAVINPGDAEPWATAKAEPQAAAPQRTAHVQQQATRLVRQKISAYQT